MIIQSNTITSVVKQLEGIANREDSNADKFLANALMAASDEGRVDMLNSEKNEYEILLARSEAIKSALFEIKSNLSK